MTSYSYEIIKPIEGTIYSPLYEDNQQVIDQMITDDQYYLVTNAGNSYMQIGGGGINGAFRQIIIDKFGYEELEEMNDKLNEFKKYYKDDGYAVFIPHSTHVQNIYRCYGMIYAVGPDESGRSLNSEESQQFLLKMKSTGFDIIKQILLYINKSVKITKIRLPLVSGAIFKPRALVYGTTANGESFIQYKDHQLSIIILMFLLNGIDDVLNPFNTHLQKIQLYNDESFENKNTLNKIFKRFTT